MREVQSPVSRDTLREWVEDRHGVYMDVRSEDDKVLRIYNETLFPESSVLFVGEAENFNDTVEICGMYDSRTQEFRFISDQLASIVDGISEMERWQGAHPSEDVYARISSYAKEANLVSLHKHCFDTVNNPHADISEFDVKAKKKIQGFREKLVSSHTCNK